MFRCSNWIVPGERILLGTAVGFNPAPGEPNWTHNFDFSEKE